MTIQNLQAYTYIHTSGRKTMTKNWNPTATTPQNPGQDTPTAIVTLPHIHNLSKTIRRILSPLGIRTGFQPHCILCQTLVRVKDPMPPQSWCCVYTGPPVECAPRSIYIYWSDWPDWQDAGAPTQGAQEGLNIRQCVPVGGCGACNE